MDELIQRLEAEAAAYQSTRDRFPTNSARWWRRGVSAGLRIALSYAREMNQ